MRSKRGQQVGFTPTDLLIVVAILAVVAAVVIPNMGGFLGMSGGEDRDTELHNVQSAVKAMMVDNNTIRITPTGAATGDMSAFPNPISPVWWKGLGPGDAPGYVLYGHDKTPDGGTSILDYYVTFATTTYCYTATRDGSVTQQTTKWNATTSSCE